MKLLLNTSDFDGKIGKTKKEVDGLGAAGQKSLGGLGSILGKVTVAVSAAVASWEVFNKAMASSQALTDSWGRATETMKTGVDNFVYAMANADFSSFNNGLDGMIQKAREMYDAFDQLANTKMSAQFATTLDQSKYRQLMAKARDKSLSPEERQAALDEATALGERINSVAAKVEADSYAALKAMFAKKSGASADIFTPAMIEEAFRIDANTTSAEDRAEIEKKYKEYLKAVDEIKDKYPVALENFFGAGSGKKGKNEKARIQAFEELARQYSDTLVKYTALMRLSDEELQTSMDTYLSAVQQRNAAAEIETSTNEVHTSLAKEAAAAAEKERKEKEQTRKEMEKMIAAQRELAQLAHSTYDTRGADQRGPTAMSAPTLSMPGSVAAITTPDVWGEHITKGAEDTAASLDHATKSVELLSGAFDSLGGSVGGTVEQMMQFISSTLDAAGAILPLIGYIQAEKVMRQENADASVKEAAAKTLSAYAGIPFAGVALGISAVAAIIGAMQAIPKFAEGGIVNRATLGVFGEAGPEAVMPLDRLKEFVGANEVRVTGQVRASGKDLVIALDNYNKVRAVK